MEKESVILGSGIGLRPYAGWNCEQAEAAINAILTRVDGAIYPTREELGTEVATSCAAGGATLCRNQAKNGIEVSLAAKSDE